MAPDAVPVMTGLAGNRGENFGPRISSGFLGHQAVRFRHAHVRFRGFFVDTYQSMCLPSQILRHPAVIGTVPAVFRQTVFLLLRFRAHIVGCGFVVPGQRLMIFRGFCAPDGAQAYQPCGAVFASAPL